MVWRSFYNALILCNFQNPEASSLPDAVNAVTGMGYSLEDLMTAGRRILALKRMINRRRGLSRADDRLPDALLRPLDEGGTQESIPDVDALLAGAYDELGWSSETGMPTDETVRRLGLATFQVQ